MKSLERVLIVSVVIVLAEVLLGHFLEHADFMSALAEARHGHTGTSLAFATLLGLRLIAIVLVPPLVVAGVGLVLYDRATNRG